MTAFGRRIAIASLLAGIIGSAAALLIDPHTWLLCYLAAFVGWSAIPIGALAVLQVTYLVRSQWTEELHEPLTAASLTIPFMAFLFAPILIGLPWLYPWISIEERHGALQATYLVPWFFIVRSAAYFVLWTMLALWTRDAYGDVGRMIRIGSAGLVLYALTASFAGIDWIESLTPDFHSSIYGLLIITFQLLAGLAFALFIVLLRGAPAWRYGEILLSVLLLWAYIHAMQYIVIWAGDIPDEAVWYERRSSSGWGAVLWILVLLQFVIPFFAMLAGRVRNGRRPLLLIAGATLVLRLLEAFWLTLPGMDARGVGLLLAIPATVLAIGSAWALAFDAVLRHIELSPRHRRDAPLSAS